MRLIMPHVSRWRSFRMDGVPKKIARLIFNRLQDVSAPMLETLKVVGERARRSFQAPPTRRCKLKPFVWGEASNLTELTVVDFPHDYFVTRFTKLQVLHLKYFDFGGAKIVENVKLIQGILVSLPNLHALQIDRHIPLSDHFQIFATLDSSLPRISHSLMTELRIYLRDTDRETFLSTLNLPRVRYFLTQMQAETAPRLQVLPSLAQYHPFPGLVSLRLVGRYSVHGTWNDMGNRRNEANMAHLEGALSGMPLLEALTFDEVDFGGGEWLICLGTTCPCLQWLTFTQSGGCRLEQIRVFVDTRQETRGFDALVRLLIQQWSSSNFITIDEVTDKWLKRSLVYEVMNPATDWELDTPTSA